MCSLVSCDLWRSAAWKSVRERDTDFVIEELSVTEQVVTEGEHPIFHNWKVWNTPRISIFCARLLQLIKQCSLFVRNTPEKKIFVLQIPVGFCLEFSLCRPPLGTLEYDVFWPSHFAFVALMNLLLWERQILHFNYGLLENNLMSFRKEHFFIMTGKQTISKRWIRRNWAVCLFVFLRLI